MKTLHSNESTKMQDDGKISHAKKPFTVQEVRLIHDNLKARGELRDIALLFVGIDTMLRASDLLKLSVDDIRDSSGKFYKKITVKQNKTAGNVIIELSPMSHDSLERWIKASNKQSWEKIFTGLHRSKNKAISLIQYQRRVKYWAELATLTPKYYSSHSIRKSRASWIYKHTNDIESVKECLGHSSVASTSSYLDIGKSKALDVARGINVYT